MTRTHAGTEDPLCRDRNRDGLDMSRSLRQARLLRDTVGAANKASNKTRDAGETPGLTSISFRPATR